MASSPSSSLSNKSPKAPFDHSGSSNMTEQSELSGVEIRIAGRPFHLLHIHILEVAFNKPFSLSVWVSIAGSCRIEFGPRQWRYGTNTG